MRRPSACQMSIRIFTDTEDTEQLPITKSKSAEKSSDNSFLYNQQLQWNFWYGKRENQSLLMKLNEAGVESSCQPRPKYLFWIFKAINSSTFGYM